MSLSRAEAEHVSECPDIGPICAVRAEPPQEHVTGLWISELRLLAELGLHPRLALQVALPIRIVDTRTRYYDLAGAPLTLDYESIHHHDETVVGVGDVQASLHSGLMLGPIAASARLGVSLPFGSTVPDPYSLGTRGLSHEHLQLGTGTLDPVFAADASWSAEGLGSVAAFGFAQVPLYEGAYGYQAGARISAGASGTLLFGEVSARLAALVYHELPERWRGLVPTEDGNQGRTDLYVGPGVTLPLGDDWSVSADVRARVFGHTVNAQLDLPVVVEIGLGTLFHLEGGAEEPPPADVADVVLAGELVPLDGVPGKLTIFDFWAPWCEACHRLDAELRAMAAKDPSIAIRRVNIVDFDSPIARREIPAVTTLPHVRLVDPRGTVELGGRVDEILEAIERHR